jgi:UDP-N-acetyl-D-mannosaminuronic acid dehydrogenase
MERIDVCVVGLGYIGLPTASLLATMGFRVHGVDLNQRTVDTINRGDVHIVEPGLDVLVRSAVQSGRLRASVRVEPADVFVLALPTPLQPDKRPDISYVEAGARAIAPYMAPGNLVILESTSPVGTTGAVAGWLHEERPDLEVAGANAGVRQVFVAHCPERVLPGQILRELVGNDRIVGGVDEASGEQARAFYAQFVGGRILVTDARTAEMAKLTENAFRDVNIAFANELAAICERLGIDVWQVIELANHHPRVQILRPGPGVGGHCIPVDPWFIIDSAAGDARLLHAAREVNSSRPHQVVDQVIAAAGDLGSSTIALLGLAYKNDIDDIRESPSLEVAELLSERGARALLVVEPHLAELPESLTRLGIEHVALDAAIEGADVVVALVRHRAFLDLAPADLEGKRVVDACGLFVRRVFELGQDASV